MLSQFVAMIVCLIFISDSFLNVFHRPTLAGVGLICIAAVSAVVFGWGGYQTVRQNTIAIATGLSSAYSGVLLWYLCAVVLPGFHG